MDPSRSTIDEYIIDLVVFINQLVVPVLFSLALLFFLINVTRYFIIGNDRGPDREKAARLALYGLLAFVLMVGVWGIVNLIVSGLGLGDANPITPDYFWRGGDGSGVPTLPNDPISPTLPPVQ